MCSFGRRTITRFVTCSSRHETSGSRLTRIRNTTPYTIILREISRIVWKNDRLVLEPGATEELDLPITPTYFRMGAVKKLQNNKEEKLDLYVDAEEIVDHEMIEIRYDEETKKFRKEF